jgi:hypothetical protein
MLTYNGTFAARLFMYGAVADKELIVYIKNSKSHQMVDITESPKKEHLPASAPRVVVSTALNHMAPNSHRILKTTPRRLVTPITPVTPHHMTRRIVGPLNLSHDMLDENLQQSNLVFSLPLVLSKTQCPIQ